MKIDRVSHHFAPAQKLHAEPKKAPKKEEELKVQPTAEAAAPAPAVQAEAAPADAPSAPETTEKKKGVIRLLEDGHFKGVAALRHRMKYFDELDHDSLPELEAPSGNGKAYSKFLAKYTEMLEASKKPETPAEGETPVAGETPVEEVPAAEEAPVIPAPVETTEPAVTAAPVENPVDPLLQLTESAATLSLLNLVA